MRPLSALISDLLTFRGELAPSRVNHPTERREADRKATKKLYRFKKSEPPGQESLRPRGESYGNHRALENMILSFSDFNIVACH